MSMLAGFTVVGTPNFPSEAANLEEFDARIVKPTVVRLDVGRFDWDKRSGPYRVSDLGQYLHRELSRVSPLAPEKPLMSGVQVQVLEFILTVFLKRFPGPKPLA